MSLPERGMSSQCEVPPPCVYDCSPFICSSMYFDEDGDLAHEFYTEQRVQVKAGVVRWVMRRINASKLTPQVDTGSVCACVCVCLQKFILFLLFYRGRWTYSYQDYM